MSESDCIVTQGLEMHFRGCDALRGIDLRVPTGSVFALLGENGAGKTTLIKILTGFQEPTHGTATVLGMDSLKDSLEIRRRIGYVSDAPALYDWMRVDEIGWFTSTFYPHGYLDRYHEWIARYELPRDRKIKHLSKGQRAKVALSLALAHDPELLILDEPTSGLDPLVRREFLESMVDRAASGRTVLLSSHQMAEVERVADRIAILHQGKIRLNAPLTELRDQVSSVTVTVVDPLAALPVIPDDAEVLSEHRSGQFVRWLIRGFTAEHEQAMARWPGILNVQAGRTSLEELFIAVGDTRRSSSSQLSKSQPANSIQE